MIKSLLKDMFVCHSDLRAKGLVGGDSGLSKGDWQDYQGGGYSFPELSAWRYRKHVKYLWQSEFRYG